MSWVSRSFALGCGRAMCVILKFNQISQRYVVKLNSIKTFLLINKNLQLLAVFDWLASSYM